MTLRLRDPTIKPLHIPWLRLKQLETEPPEQLTEDEVKFSVRKTRILHNVSQTPQYPKCASRAKIEATDFIPTQFRDPREKLTICLSISVIFSASQRSGVKL